MTVLADVSQIEDLAVWGDFGATYTDQETDVATDGVVTVSRNPGGGLAPAMTCCNMFIKMGVICWAAGGGGVDGRLTHRCGP